MFVDYKNNVQNYLDNLSEVAKKKFPPQQTARPFFQYTFERFLFLLRKSSMLS